MSHMHDETTRLLYTKRHPACSIQVQGRVQKELLIFTEVLQRRGLRRERS